MLENLGRREDGHVKNSVKLEESFTLVMEHGDYKFKTTGQRRRKQNN